MNTNLNMRTILIDRLKPAKYSPGKDLKPGDSAYETMTARRTRPGPFSMTDSRRVKRLNRSSGANGSRITQRMIRYRNCLGLKAS